MKGEKMKLFRMIVIGLYVLVSANNIFAQEMPRQEKFDTFGYAYQFVFFSVLEGLYRDGASLEDARQILMKKDKDHGYEHFIYSCPICTSTLLAVKLYANKPEFEGYKFRNNDTFGPGFSQEVHRGLYSQDVRDRLLTIHQLVSRWIKERMNSMKLTEEERTSLKRAFLDGRDQGMKALESFKNRPEIMKQYAPGYINQNECAICNAASFMDFKINK